MKRKSLKWMRSVIALVLFVAVLLPQQALAFSDVNDGDWYQDAITYLSLIHI